MSTSTSQTSGPDSFRRCIDYLHNLEISGETNEDNRLYNLSVGVLKLRLCRSADVGNGNIDTNALQCPELPAGQQVAGDQQRNDWLAEELDFLSLKHYDHGARGAQRTSISKSELDLLTPKIVALAEKLEAGDEKKTRLITMRSQDAKQITGHEKASEEQLRILGKSASRRADPEFIKLVTFRDGHRYTGIQVDGRGVFGDAFSDSWKGGPVGSSGTYDGFTVGPNGSAMAGNTYGGPHPYISTTKNSTNHEAS
ncbi:hypothetical protein ONZ43_g2922 [Nemania bipapillata]|uniref:Uncharacterized protein n=1 Tax=Nemania bipapillata TaxID=110536 RepID=A0ACC2IYW3_9PEZI|nr:hypothetical protein ONZ43_g2922 [Nemania bipapillata]